MVNLDDYDYKETLEDILDQNYGVTMKRRRIGRFGDHLDVLIKTPRGVDKSREIEDWAKKKGVNLVKLCEQDLQFAHGDEYKLYDKLCALDTPNSVLFLPKLHKSSQAARNALLSPISDHFIPDRNSLNGIRNLENFVMTIATTNLYDSETKEEEKFDQCMLGKFSHYELKD